jgi:hypothetical protein
MRLLCTNTSPFGVLPLPADNTCTPYDVAALIAPYVRANGYINHVCLEFEGQFVPLVHDDEVRLVSELVSIYQRTCFEARLSVRAMHATKTCAPGAV